MLAISTEYKILFPIIVVGSTNYVYFIFAGFGIRRPPSLVWEGVSGWKEEFPLTPDKADITPTSLQGPRCITRSVLKSRRKHGFKNEQNKYFLFS